MKGCDGELKIAPARSEKLNLAIGRCSRCDDPCTTNKWG